MAVSFICGGYWSTWSKPLTCCKSLTNFITYCCIKYTSPWTRIELTTLLVIGIGCTGSCKSNYHTITTTMAPDSCEVYSIFYSVFSNGIGITKWYIDSHKAWTPYKCLSKDFKRLKWWRHYRWYSKKIFWYCNEEWQGTRLSILASPDLMSFFNSLLNVLFTSMVKFKYRQTTKTH